MGKKRSKKTAKSKGGSKEALSCNSTGLPVEILSKIFRILHESASASSVDSDGGSSGGSTLGDPTEDSISELREVSAFPNAISRVCSQWDLIMASHPEFWTRIIVHLDRPSHLEFFKTALKRSKRLDLHTIAIVRSADDHRIADHDKDYDDPEERANVEALLLHLMSCRPLRKITHSVIIDTLLDDSLPLRIDKSWSSLHRLVLNSRECIEEPPLPLWTVYPSQKGSFSSDLRVLHLVGSVFAKLRAADGWQTAFADMDLVSLKVSHLSAMDFGNREYFVEDLMEDLRVPNSIEHLSLVHVDLPHDIESFWGYYNAESVDTVELESLYLEDIPRMVLQPLLMYLTKSHRVPLMRFKHCRFHGVGMAQADAVEIADIESSDSMSAFFQGIDATHLRIVDCPGLDDESVASLYPWTHFNADQIAPMPKLESLTIVDCAGWTHWALREALRVRNCGYEEQNWNTEDLQSLVLAGSCPAPTQGETRWYASNVRHFDATNVILD